MPYCNKYGWNRAFFTVISINIRKCSHSAIFGLNNEKFASGELVDLGGGLQTRPKPPTLGRYISTLALSFELIFSPQMHLHKLDLNTDMSMNVTKNGTKILLSGSLDLNLWTEDEFFSKNWS